MRRGNIPRKNVNNVLTDFLASSETHVNKGRERSVYFIFLRNVTIQALINTRNSLKLRRVQSS